MAFFFQRVAAGLKFRLTGMSLLVSIVEPTFCFYPLSLPLLLSLLELLLLLCQLGSADIESGTLLVETLLLEPLLLFGGGS